ncbi:viroplasmin family protein [Paenibacillus doosanensis]|uniref:ribonuclease H1 domain-containing protein n=1 Tax=Paenibacillus doosanensis TaxID=1229154 RepID=UPI00218064F2|nr:viroplasmin family protein [Paenibacillus doosanensis]MCS7464199.1 viroplasmin family protein [Paenibacillus doosanensis]
MNNKFYVVAKGKNPGIYNKWDGGAKQNVEGYKGAVYKSFSTLELAEIWWRQIAPEAQSPNYHFDQLEISVEFESTGAEEEPGPYYTYLIIDPRTQMPFYVGQTQDMEHRKISHLRVSYKHRAYKKWIASIRKDGLEPEFQIQPTKADSLRSETKWVKKLAYQGIRVLNGWREHKEWIDLILRQKNSNQ